MDRGKWSPLVRKEAALREQGDGVEGIGDEAVATGGGCNRGWKRVVDAVGLKVVVKSGMAVVDGRGCAW